MRQLRTAFFCLSALLFLAGAARAGDLGTLYTQIGTDGIGLGYAASFKQNWALRGQVNYLPSTSYSGNVGDYGSNATANVTVQWNSVAALVDWYPYESGFRLTGGIVANNNQLTVNATNATIGGTGGTTVANANATIKLSQDPAPYLGLGYMTRPKDASGLGFNLDLGVMFDNPTVSLTAPGATQAQINSQISNIQNAINQLQYFPVIGLGISYSF